MTGAPAATAKSRRAGEVARLIERDLVGGAHRGVIFDSPPIGAVTFHHARPKGPAPWWWRPSGTVFDQFLGAAENDPVLAEWFLRRFSLLDNVRRYRL